MKRAYERNHSETTHRTRCAASEEKKSFAGSTSRNAIELSAAAAAATAADDDDATWLLIFSLGYERDKRLDRPSRILLGEDDACPLIASGEKCKSI